MEPSFKHQYSDITTLYSFLDSERYNSETVRTVTIQVTNDCNLRCTYCYQHCKHSGNIDVNLAKKFIDDLLANKYKEYLDIDVVNFLIFDFIGGEPFIAIKEIEEITEYIELKFLLENSKFLYNHRYSFSSNGTLYRNECVQNYLKKYNGLISISVTVDGNKEVHDACRVFPDGSGSYDLAHEAQTALRKKYGYDGTKMTLSPENLPYLADSFIYMYNDGYTNIHMNCVFEDVWTEPSSYRELYKQGIKIIDWIIENKITNLTSMFFDMRCGKITEDTPNWCGGVGYMMSVSPSGNIYPCQRYSEISVDSSKIKPYVIGTVDSGINVTDVQKENIKNLQNVTAWSCSDEECRNCPIGISCAYCSAFNYETYGIVNKRTKFHCKTHKIRYLLAYYYKHMALKNGLDINDILLDIPDALLFTSIEIKDLLGDELFNHFNNFLIEINMI